MQHLMVRVVSPNFANWKNVVNGTRQGLMEHGITSWTIYQDSDNPNAGMVHFVVEDMGRAMEFFRSAEFQKANADAKVSDREFYTAEKR